MENVSTNRNSTVFSVRKRRDLGVRGSGGGLSNEAFGAGNGCGKFDDNSGGSGGLFAPCLNCGGSVENSTEVQ